MAVSIPKLFQPVRVGTANLQHRVVMAPMSRFRADKQHVPGALAIEYYKQRTSVPGTLAIAESTTIAPRAGGNGRSPGIWNDEQVAGWKPVRLQVFLTSRIGGRRGLSLRNLTYTCFGPLPLWADRRCCAQKRLVYLPPARRPRTRGKSEELARERRIPARRTEPDSSADECR